jgi:type IV pilus assembly protein PilM
VHEDFVVEENLVSAAQIVEQLDAKLQLIYPDLSEPLEQIILGGEGARLLDLAEVISSRFNIPTTIANPFLGMKLSQAVTPESVDQVSPLMLVSCGLALRAAHNDSN